MTAAAAFTAAGTDLAAKVETLVPGAVIATGDREIRVASGRLVAVMTALRGAGFEMLIAVTGVDYVDHFEMVYHLLSLSRNSRAVVKVRCGEGRTEPSVPSVMEVWRGADLQEREVYDLMGIHFDGRDDMKRIFLWEGFEGHPHRKDYL